MIGSSSTGFGLLGAFAEAHAAGDLERHLAGVDVVVRAVEQRDLDVDHRVAGDDAVFHLLLHALVDGRNVFARHDAADDLVDELVAGARLLRLDAQHDVAVLAAAAGLAHELAFLLDRFANRLAVGDLRLADVGLDLELARMRSTMMSRCSSPMPEMIVCPDSSSVCTRNDGSSFASFCSAMPIFSWSALVFGSTATEITGSGNSMRSSVMTLFGSHSVSPVVTSFRPTAAAMSPARTSLISSRSFECICRMRPMRSFLPLTGL